MRLLNRLSKPIVFAAFLTCLAALLGHAAAEPQTPPRQEAPSPSAGPLDEERRQRQINADLWRPFMAHFADGEAEAYIALRAPQFVRVAAGSPRRLIDRATYATQTRGMFETLRKRGIRATLEVRLQERLGTETQAFESGIWRLAIVRSDGQSSFQYGRFQVLLGRQEGSWKMLLDEDVALNAQDGERLFAATAPIAG